MKMHPKSQNIYLMILKTNCLKALFLALYSESHTNISRKNKTKFKKAKKKKMQNLRNDFYFKQNYQNIIF